MDNSNVSLNKEPILTVEVGGGVPSNTAWPFPTFLDQKKETLLHYSKKTTLMLSKTLH